MQIANSISLRISLIFAIMTASILLVMGMMVHQLVNFHFKEQDLNLVEGKIQLISNILRQNPTASPELSKQLKDALVGHHGLVVQIQRPMGQTIFSTLPAHSSNLSLLLTEGSPLVEWTSHQRQYRGMIAKHTDQIEHVQIMVGVNTAHHMSFLSQFRQELLLIGIGGTGLLTFLGWLAARRGLLPAQTMAKVAEGISAQHLSQRLDHNAAPTELQPLVLAFNDMLDRLENALAKLSEFSADLAHELRTPINTLMTQTQVCLSKPRDTTAYKDVLFSNLEEYERLARMIADMLFLAQADDGSALCSLESVNLADEVTMLYEFYDALAEEKAMTLQQIGNAQVQGNRLMLRRAFSNLIANAIRYGTAGSPILIVFRQYAASVSISIENRAAQIPAKQLDRLFDRFYRVDESRQRVAESSGLGLAITKSIVQSHSGEISVSSTKESITFQIQLPTVHTRPQD